MPIKPPPPASNSREDVLNHAIEFGEYTRRLELNNLAWIDFYKNKGKK